MTRVCLKRIETVENIFLGTGEKKKKSPEIRNHPRFSNKKKWHPVGGGEFAVVF